MRYSSSYYEEPRVLDDVIVLPGKTGVGKVFSKGMFEYKGISSEGLYPNYVIEEIANSPADLLEIYGFP